MNPPIKPGLAAQADALVKLAESWCRRGLHVNAADAFRRAGEMYSEAGDWYTAAVCEGQRLAELSQCRPSAPANTSALVD